MKLARTILTDSKRVRYLYESFDLVGLAHHVNKRNGVHSGDEMLFEFGKDKVFDGRFSELRMD